MILVGLYEPFLARALAVMVCREGAVIPIPLGDLRFSALRDRHRSFDDACCKENRHRACMPCR